MGPSGLLRRFIPSTGDNLSIASQQFLLYAVINLPFEANATDPLEIDSDAIFIDQAHRIQNERLWFVGDASANGERGFGFRHGGKVSTLVA